MVHLGPLPGSPHFEDLDSVLRGAVRDARVLEEAGFDALCVENYGDAPFSATSVPPSTVAGMTRAISSVLDACPLPVGINVLRNDATSALAIAAACSAAFIRVNVLTGSMFTDQGIISGQAAEVARARSAVAPNTEVYADVFVKHAVPPPGVTFEDAAADTWTRGGADALIVSGPGTGEPADLALVRAARKVAPDAPLLVGSGVTAQTVSEVLAEADGVIVGTSIKEEGVTSAPVSLRRAAALVKAAS
ncbi:MAG: BtpA/SgcQ family protein [Acidimicrobiia bacterium]